MGKNCKSGEVLFSAEYVELDSKPLPAGSINLTLHKARKLEKKGAFGKADPYTILSVGKEKFKTETVKNNQNPEWQYTIKFDLTKDTKEEIAVEVFDEDIGKDDRLGDTKIPLREIIQQRNIVNKWIPLKNCKSGEVFFSAEYVELDSKPLPEPAVTKAQPTKPSEPTEKVAVPVAVKKDIPSEPLPAGSLKLTLHKARKLEKKGAFGKADPYTVLTVGKEKFKTATVSNNQNPEWNHTITFDLTKDTEDEMTVEVFDSDIGKDDCLGDTKISLREICH